MSSKPVTIVGGGLAGLTLGIGLRQREVPVTVWEAGHYPRQRVCGEFISGRGQEALSRLGLIEVLNRAGAVRARTAAFFSATKATVPRRLSVGAICLSRLDMDRALAERLRELGGKLLEEKRWRQDFSEGVVRATGRRTGAENDRDLWFGLKVHASPHRDSKPDADLELHFTRHGYVGLCSLSGGVVNVCGLFSRRTKRTTESQHAFMTAGASCQATTDARDLLRGEPGSILRQRLARAEFHEHSFCAVAGLSLTPWRACLRTEFSLGDSITMIPPMTGNGMSMAFESAEMAVEPLAAWSRGKLTWLEAQQSHSRQCDVVFSRRLRWARWLQQVALMPKMQNILLRLLSASDWCWRSMFEKTR